VHSASTREVMTVPTNSLGHIGVTRLTAALLLKYRYISILSCYDKFVTLLVGAVQCNGVHCLVLYRVVCTWDPVCVRCTWKVPITPTRSPGRIVVNRLGLELWMKCCYVFRAVVCVILL